MTFIPMGKVYPSEIARSMYGYVKGVPSDSWLTPSERTYQRKLPYIKRFDFCRGREAAKRAIMAYMETYEHIRISPEYIAIYSESGVPRVRFDAPYTFLSDALCLSISHTEDRAIAGIVPRSCARSVGVDIEHIRLFSKETLRAFLNQSEYDFCRDTGLEYATVYWSLKEAFLKAWGTGLRVHPIHVEIPPMNLYVRQTNFFLSGEEVPVNVSWTKDDNRYIIASITLV